MTEQSGIPELSVVILCYHAADIVEELVARVEQELDAEQVNYELILVGNYLPEDKETRTSIVLNKLAGHNPRIHVVAREKKGMMGWDMRSGLEEAKGAHIAVIDGDGQMPMTDIIKVYRVLQTGSCDLVKTFRAQRHDGLYRRTISSCYNFLFRLLYPSAHALHDINSKPKIMTREAYSKMNLVSNNWFTDAEIMIEALKHNLSIGEIPTIFYKNERRATFVPFSAIFEFLRDLLYYRFFKKD